MSQYDLFAKLVTGHQRVYVFGRWGSFIMISKHTITPEKYQKGEPVL